MRVEVGGGGGGHSTKAWLSRRSKVMSIYSACIVHKIVAGHDYTLTASRNVGPSTAATHLFSTLAIWLSHPWSLEVGRCVDISC